MEPTQQQLDCRQDFQFFLAQVICFLGFKRRTTSKYFFFFSFPFQAIPYFKQQPRKLLCFSHFHPWGTQAPTLKGREQHRWGGTHPQQGKAHSLNFTSTWASAGKTTGNQRGLRNLVLRRGTGWPQAGGYFRHGSWGQPVRQMRWLVPSRSPTLQERVQLP